MSSPHEGSGEELERGAARRAESPTPLSNMSDEPEGAPESRTRVREQAPKKERMSGDCIWLSPHAQRRMFIGRRTSF
jgi:hypothetical protein